jgi:hypothetical protein
MDRQGDTYEHEFSERDKLNEFIYDLIEKAGGDYTESVHDAIAEYKRTNTALAEEEGAERATLQSSANQLVINSLHSQHPLMGVYSNVFMRLGGEDWILEWARENPSKYLNQLVKMVPNLQPTQGLVGDVNIRISNDLPRSGLDE